MQKKRVLLAMSGGLDSSMAAVLLKDQGYGLVGVTYRAWDAVSKACMEKETGCCTVDAIFGAKSLAEEMGFEHHIIDFRNIFKDTIIKNFVDEYLAGNTPNPCVLCNARIKWGELVDMAERYGCDFIATGHYARVKHENGRYFMAKGIDEFKDQTYFLWMLSQGQLKRTIFPLGGYHKDEIRGMARERGFQVLADKRESQEICFIPDNDYRRFLRENVPSAIESIGRGNFVDTEGKVLGQHHGYPFYTIGQRKGLEIAVGHPLYVLDIRKGTNTVVVGSREQLAQPSMKVTGLVLTKYPTIPEGLEVQVKIRYRNKGHQCRLYPVYEGVRVEFDEPVPAIAPGQSAVFYEGDDMIGGGIIRRS